MTRVAGFLFGALMTLGVASTAGCAEPTNTKPIAEFPAAAEWLAKAPAAAGPAIVISQVKPIWEADPARQEVRLLLVNPTGEPIEYTGYTMDSWSEPPPPGEISPLYLQQELDDAGTWREAGFGWCGTGAGTMTVPPGHAGEFMAAPSANARTRIGFNVTQNGSTGTTITKPWSPTIEPREEGPREESAPPATP